MKFVALLRGINNIGASKRVSMAELRVLFESMGFRDVRTVLNSGNVVFSLPGKSRRGVLDRIEKTLPAKLGFPCTVIVLTSDEVTAIVRDNPLARVAHDPSRLLVVIPKQASDLAQLAPFAKKRWTPERLAVGQRVAYLWCANGVGESALWPIVERALDRSATARNIRTMTKLMALVEERQ